MADALEVPNKKWTYADYKSWELKPGERKEEFRTEARRRRILPRITRTL